MQCALLAAQEAAAAGEVPVGAVLVDSNNAILAQAGNRCIRDHDPSAHAEMVVIRRAAALLRNYRLPGCRLYVSLEPCIMCAGVCVQARIESIVFGTLDPKAGALQSCYQIGGDGLLNHRLVVRGGLLAEKSAALLHDFFRIRRLQNTRPQSR
ncbi:MAG: nucleoside deaminase [Desulfobulbaceae bacterium]|nr:nucleoside deaminase [Desulfobulbaceae bacterium]